VRTAVITGRRINGSEEIHDFTSAALATDGAVVAGFSAWGFTGNPGITMIAPLTITLVAAQLP
jgi:hypothetical protein